MSMSRKKCCVPGCLDSGNSSPTMHLFPNPSKDRARFNQWVTSIGGDIIGLDNEDIYKHRSVCHVHFEEKYCCRYNRLSNIAVPTLNLRGPLSLPRFSFGERRPMRETQNCPTSSSSVTPSTSGVSAALQAELSSITIEDNNESFDNAEYKENTDPSCMAPNISLGTPSNALHDHDYYMKTRKEDTPAVSFPGSTMELLTFDIEKAATKKNTVGQKARANIRIGKAVQKPRRYAKVSREERNVYNKLIQARIKLSKCRNKIKKQSVSLRAAKKIISNPALLATMENLSSTTKTLFTMQFREVKKKNKGRRFTMDEKILALSIFKQAPKSYRFFRRLLILPAPQTLAKLISNANISPGINKNIFNQIKNVADKMKTHEKLCTVIFDEMHLRAGVSYNDRKDKVVGFTTDGDVTRQDFADYAQVFMIRGVVKNYKQPISYTFSAAPTSGQEIAKQIKIIISELQKAGLIVVATICDQGSNNRNAIKLLTQETRGIFLRNGEEPKDNIILINNQEVVPLYDPPHLLKCIRNNLLTKDLEYTINGVKQIAKWDHIKQLHKENPGYKGVRLIPKLTDSHVMPEKSKMKVKYASQIFSRTVATNMGYLADKGILPSECKGTADALLFFDNLFDSQNGSYAKKKNFSKPLLGPVTPTSEHHQHWTQAKKIIQSMKFISKSGNPENVPTIKNWAWTLDNLEVLLKNLEKNFNVTSVWMRHLNQDPIENFFGAVRSHGCRNTNPTPDKFEGSFTTLLINNMSSVHAPSGTNCEVDTCKNLYDLIVTECKATTTSDNEYYLPNINLEASEQNDPRVAGILNYITGYFVKKTQSKIFKSCQTCKNNLISVDQHEYIRYREYAGRRWLCSPTDAIVKCIADLQNITNAVLKENLHKNYIKELIKTSVLMFVDFNFLECQEHKSENIDFLIKLTSKFFIHNYCKDLNKILCGKRDCSDDTDLLQVKAMKYFKKCYKRHLK